ncbi:MAG: hypothetical protein M3437_17250 [Chloroflexota bacterium]|nr:hypothetical protein [Chloroflexota bacterium]MDQ5865712.1 hypothetical protein [Chloroflexota bacterium]
MSWLLSYWPPALVLAVMWLVVSLITGTWNPIKFAMGEDNRYSISKFQLLLWTVTVLFAYIAVVYARIEQGLSGDVPNVPDNVLLALGLSGATSVVAKGIKVNNLRTGKELSTTLNDHGPLSTLLTDDDGSLSLHKLQYLVWTFVAIGVFLVSLDQSNRLTLPDIDTTLLVLSGIGAGTYLGKKLVPQSPYEQNRVAQAAASQGAQVTTQTTTTTPATVVVNVPAAAPTPPPTTPAGGGGPPGS